MHDVNGYNEALAIYQKYLTPRARTLAHLEKYVEGTQYDGLPDWFSSEKPLWERKPCIVYPIVKAAIDSNGDLLLGEGRFPDVSVDELTGDEAASFETAINQVTQQSRLKAAAREVFAAGQGSKSSCAIFGVRMNRLFIDTVLARWCVPTLNVDGSVISLEVKYPYLEIVRVKGDDKVVCKLYRRVIDAARDVTYLPAEGREDGTDPSWQEDPTRTVVHGLGFCPVVWYAHLRGCCAVNDYDGRAIHEHLTDEIRAHDFALSQRHRAALYAGDPQWTEIGVDEGFNPTSPGRIPEVPASLTGMPGEMPHAMYVSSPRVSKARKKSPGDVWQYPGKNPEVKVQLHTLPGDALKALDDHARDLRMKIAESLGVVFLDAENLPNESRISGRALESFKARQLDRVNYYRSDFGDHFLLPSLGMLLRISLATSLRIEGLDVVRKVVSQTGERWSWHAPPLQLIWGEYFQPSGEEEELLARSAVQLKEAGIATTKVLVKKLRSILGVRDVEAYMAELEEEQAEVDAREEKMMAAEAKIAAANKPAPAPASKAKK